MKAWYLWLAVGGVMEAVGLVTTLPTLSATWLHMRDSLPFWASVALTAILSATLVWLIAAHWIFTVLDRPGLDRWELLTILVGAGWGAVSAVLVRRSTKDSE